MALETVTFVYKEAVDIISAVVPPLGRVIISKTVTHRMDKAEANLRLAHDEIKSADIFKEIPDERWKDVQELVNRVRASLTNLEDDEHFPASLNPSALLDARECMVQSQAVLRRAKATSAEAQTAAMNKRRLRDLEAKRIAAEEKQRLAREKEMRRAAEVQVARLQLKKACKQVPGLDFQKFLDIVIAILQAKSSGRPIQFKDFEKLVQNCIRSKQSKKRLPNSPLSAEARDAVIERLTQGLSALASGPA